MIKLRIKLFLLTVLKIAIPTIILLGMSTVVILVILALWKFITS